MAEAQENPAVIAAIAASFLRQGRVLDRISRGLTLIGCVAVFAGTYTGAPLPITLAAIFIVLLGLVQAYFALRASFDADIFGHFAKGSFTATSFDSSMKRLGLIAADRAARPMSDRAQGAMGLVRKQVVAVVLQVICILALPLLGMVL